jgi:hypothetical protein
MKRRRLILLLAPVMALISTLGALALSSTAAEAATAQRCNQTGPGWFVTDLNWNPSCPGSGPVPTPNYWSLTSWYDQPLMGTPMTICNGYNPFPLPDGWAELRVDTSVSTCRDPGNSLPQLNNVLIVQRERIGTPVIHPGGIAIYPDRTLAIYGFNFYPNDQVFVNGIPATVVYDSLALGQINAIPPASVHGGATVVVQNSFGEQSAGSQITLP